MEYCDGIVDGVWLWIQWAVLVWMRLIADGFGSLVVNVHCVAAAAVGEDGTRRQARLKVGGEGALWSPGTGPLGFDWLLVTAPKAPVFDVHGQLGFAS